MSKRNIRLSIQIENIKETKSAYHVSVSPESITSFNAPLFSIRINDNLPSVTGISNAKLNIMIAEFIMKHVQDGMNADPDNAIGLGALIMMEHLTETEIRTDDMTALPDEAIDFVSDLFGIPDDEKEAFRKATPGREKNPSKQSKRTTH